VLWSKDALFVQRSPNTRIATRFVRVVDNAAERTALYRTPLEVIYWAIPQKQYVRLPANDRFCIIGLSETPRPGSWQNEDVNLQDVQGVLRGISDIPKDRIIKFEVIKRQLEDCQSVLRRETMFQPIPPGAPTPMMRYELVEAQDSIELALKAIGENDTEAMLQHVHKACVELSVLNP
jgi:hypothetical protein